MGFFNGIFKTTPGKISVEIPKEIQEEISEGISENFLKKSMEKFNKNSKIIS